LDVCVGENVHLIFN